MTGLHKLPSCTSILYRRGWGPTDYYVEKRGVKTFESYTLGSSLTFPMCLASSSPVGLKSSFDHGVECAATFDEKLCSWVIDFEEVVS